jgi:HEAT repeats
MLGIVSSTVKRFVAGLIEDLREIFGYRKVQLREERIPRDSKGQPDLSFYSEPLRHYIDLYNSFLNTRWEGSTKEQQNLAWKQRVHGEWGLLAKGGEALPFLLALIRHPNPDAREDASYLLGELKKDAHISEQLLACLQSENDLVVKSAILESLGKLRYRPAIPAITSLILSKDTDVDTRWNAADSLGRIVGEDFSGAGKLEKAEAWLAAHAQGNT